MANFSTVADFKSIVGEDFLREYTSDLNGPQAAQEIESCLEEAHDLILTYMLHRYSEAELSNSVWVKRREVRIAAYFLCARRGQSPTQGIQLLYSQAIEQLELIMNSAKLMIPDIPGRHQLIPTVNNYEVDDSLTIDRLRRRGRDSTSDYSGSPGSRDDLLPHHPF